MSPRMPTPDFRARRNITIGFVLTTQKAIRPIRISRVPRLYAESVAIRLSTATGRRHTVKPGSPLTLCSCEDSAFGHIHLACDFSEANAGCVSCFDLLPNFFGDGGTHSPFVPHFSRGATHQLSAVCLTKTALGEGKSSPRQLALWIAVAFDG